MDISHRLGIGPHPDRSLLVTRSNTETDNGLWCSFRRYSVLFTTVMHRVVIVHWPAMMMSQAVVRVHIVMMLVRRVTRHRCLSCLAERWRQRNSQCDERRNELTFQQHGVSFSA